MSLQRVPLGVDRCPECQGLGKWHFWNCQVVQNEQVAKPTAHPETASPSSQDRTTAEKKLSPSELAAYLAEEHF